MSSADLQTWANIAIIVQTVFFIVSVLFIGYQVYERNRLTRAANTLALVEVASPYYLQLSQDRKLAELSQDRKLAELWVHGAKDYETMDEVERFRYIQLISGWLTHHENAYYQYRRGLLDKTIYQAWAADLQHVVRRVQLGLFWDKYYKRFFQTEFQQKIEQLIQHG